MDNQHHRWLLKRNTRRSLRLITGLVMVGLTGLFIGLHELNRRYDDQVSRISGLQSRISSMSGLISDMEAKLSGYDLMEFKAVALQKHYPQFGEIVETVFQKSHQYGFQPELVLGIMEVESGFNPRAISNRGAHGLMQINFAVWKDELSIDRRRIYDIEYNIDLGLQILTHYYRETEQDLALALHRYNNGYRYNNTRYVQKVDSTFQETVRLMSRNFHLKESTLNR